MSKLPYLLQVLIMVYQATLNMVRRTPVKKNDYVDFGLRDPGAKFSI